MKRLSVCLSVCLLALSTFASAIDGNPQNPANWQALPSEFDGLDIAHTWTLVNGTSTALEVKRIWGTQTWIYNGVPQPSIAPSIPILDGTDVVHTITMDSEGTVTRKLQWIGLGPAPAYVLLIVHSDLTTMRCYQTGSASGWNGHYGLSEENIEGTWTTPFVIQGVPAQTRWLQQALVTNGIARLPVEKEAHAQTTTSLVGGLKANGVWASAEPLVSDVDNRIASLDINGVSTHNELKVDPNMLSWISFPYAEHGQGGIYPQAVVQSYQGRSPVPSVTSYFNTSSNATWHYAPTTHTVWTEPGLTHPTNPSHEDISFQGSTTNLSSPLGAGNYEYIITYPGQAAVGSYGFAWLPSHPIPSQILTIERPKHTQDYVGLPGLPMWIVKSEVHFDPKSMGNSITARFIFDWIDDPLHYEATRYVVTHIAGKPTVDLIPYYDFHRFLLRTQFEFNSGTSTTMAYFVSAGVPDAYVTEEGDKANVTMVTDLIKILAKTAGVLWTPGRVAWAAVEIAAMIAGEVNDTVGWSPQPVAVHFEREGDSKDEPKQFWPADWNTEIAYGHVGATFESCKSDFDWHVVYRPRTFSQPKVIDKYNTTGYVNSFVKYFDDEDDQFIAPRRYTYRIHTAGPATWGFEGEQPPGSGAGGGG